MCRRIFSRRREWTRCFRSRDAHTTHSFSSTLYSFINTVAGWVNLLLLSSSGPIKIPVGACATALQSVEIAVDTILSGKAKVMIAGGFDDFSEEGSYEFANMKATSNSETEFAAGREPNEMSCPTTGTCSGFSTFSLSVFSRPFTDVDFLQWRRSVAELESSRRPRPPSRWELLFTEVSAIDLRLVRFDANLSPSTVVAFTSTAADKAGRSIPA